MTKVRMVNPNNGQPYEFDSKYAEEYAAKGWTRVKELPVGVSVPTRPDSAAPADVTARGIAGPQPLSPDTSTPGPHYTRDMLSQAIPSLVAGGVNAFVPESIPLRMLVSLLVATPAELAAQRIRQEPANVGNAFLRGGSESLATGVGEGLSAGRRAMVQRPRVLAGEALAVPSKLAAKTRGAPDIGLREGVMPGPRGLYEGTAKAEALLNASHAAEDATVKALEDEARAASAIELGKGITPSAGPQVNLSELASKAYQRVVDKLGPALSAEGKKELQDAADELSTRAMSSVNDRSIEIPQNARDIIRLKRTYDRAPASIRMLTGADRIKADIASQFEKAVADESRLWLRDNVPNLGRQMQRSHELMKLVPAVQYAESAPTAAVTFNPVSALEKELSTRQRRGIQALGARPFGNAAATPVARVLSSQGPRAIGLGVNEWMQFLKDQAAASAPADTTR
jgi:hypothetical protein